MDAENAKTIRGIAQQIRELAGTDRYGEQLEISGHLWEEAIGAGAFSSVEYLQLRWRIADQKYGKWKFEASVDWLIEHADQIPADASRLQGHPSPGTPGVYIDYVKANIPAVADLIEAEAGAQKPSYLGVTLDPDGQAIIRGEDRIGDLPRMRWRLLLLLYNAGESGQTRSEIYDRLYEKRVVSQNALDQHKRSLCDDLSPLGLTIESDNRGVWTLASLPKSLSKN